MENHKSAEFNPGCCYLLQTKAKVMMMMQYTNCVRFQSYNLQNTDAQK